MCITTVLQEGAPDSGRQGLPRPRRQGGGDSTEQEVHVPPAGLRPLLPLKLKIHHSSPLGARRR